MLRKKVSSLEDQLVSSERRDREREQEFSKNRRMMKLIEKYKCELDEAHSELRELKMRLTHCSEIQVITVVVFFFYHMTKLLSFWG